MIEEDENPYRRAVDTPTPEPKPVHKGPPKSAWSTMPQAKKDRINDALRKAGLPEVIE
jgi:hypothetical protein